MINFNLPPKSLWLLLLPLCSCNHNYKLNLLVSEEDKIVMREIAKEINDHSRFEIEVVSKDSLTEVNAIKSLKKGEYDITTVDNTLDYHESKKGLKTIIPFFHEVLVVASRYKLTQPQIDSLIQSGDYMVLTKEEDELSFFRKMIPHFTGESKVNYRLEPHYDLRGDLKKYDLILFFSALENYELGEMIFREEAFIYSLDHEETYGKGSFIEGFCQAYKKTTPYIISRYAFGITLEKPVFSLAVHELLMATTDIPNKVVYDLIETIHQHHIVPIFESSNSYTFEVNHQDINLSFPFHSGTIDYMERDKPTFVERYAEFMGFVLSVFIVVFGLSASIRANINQRKKDRMDLYYKKLLDIKSRLSETSTLELNDVLTQMQLIVFDLLIKEKLSANNEFVIFMMLWEELNQELRNRQDVAVAART